MTSYDVCCIYFQRIIDVLKFDVEFSEWSAINTMLTEGSLRNVKQIAMELHAWRESCQSYVYFWRLLVGLHNAGFERWTLDRITHLNCFIVNGLQCCRQANVYFINVNYARPLHFKDI